MNKHLLSLIGVLICCINAYAVEFKARIVNESKNSVFSSTSDGLLTAGTGGKILVRVPAALKISNGLYTLPSTITTPGASAFTEVTTISKLTLGPVT